MNEVEWLGNMMADAYAGEYASRVALSVAPRADIAIADATCRLILARRVAIDLHCVTNFPQAKKKRENREAQAKRQQRFKPRLQKEFRA